MAKPRSHAYTLPGVLDEHDEYVSGERRLMMAVIIAAINDAVGASAVQDRRGDNRQQLIAQRWFDERGSDFQMVCLAAGLEPENVRKAALAYIDEDIDLSRIKFRGLNSKSIRRREDARRAA